jgi:glycosyltransferase involved in cell wall biosynthesis
MLIVNNGLMDLRGHYFETSVSTAEAAVRAKLDTVLVGHATCPPEIIPEWLEFLPLCRTDHWMAGPPAAGFPASGLRGDLAAQSRTTIDAVLAGKVGLREFLEARFEPQPVSAPIPAQTGTAAEPPRPRTPMRVHVKRAMRSATPPLLWSAGRWVYLRRHFAVAVVKAVLPPFLYRGARTFLRQALGRDPRPTPAAAPAPAPPAVAPKDPFLVRLERAGFGHEYDNVNLYQQDLEAVLALVGLGPNDHVFLPTAHARELIAIRRIVDLYGPDRSPTFHLEFRHALDFDEADLRPLNPYTAAHLVLFDLYRSFGHSPRVRVYTDTEELTESYVVATGLPFETLPIPFRTDRITPRSRRADEPLRLTFLGDARDEKGFHWLPDLIVGLMDEAKAGRVTFALQASLLSPQYNPESIPAMARVRALADEPYMELHGLDAPLSPEQYFDLLSRADVMLCPYSPENYKRRSSGTLTEALAAGIPTVVPADTWLERQQPPGTGESFTDRESFVAAVREVVTGYASYHHRAKVYRDRWLSVHTPDNLVRVLLGRPAASGAGPLQDVA